jgi:rhomboid family protein
VVLPVHDVNPVRRFPLVTLSLIVANVVSFVTTPAANVCELNAFLYEWGAVPLEMMRNEPLSAVPTVTCGVGPPSYDKQVALSVLFSMFLHAGWLHLLGNMLFLYVFGNNVEDRLGRLRYLVFYLLSGYAATYAFAFLNAESTATLVGASGAVSGVLGAYLWMFPRALVICLVPFLFFLPFLFPAWLVLGMWIALQFLYMQSAAIGGEAGVAYAAHVAGFVAGFLMAAATAKREPPRQVEPAWTRYHQR